MAHSSLPDSEKRLPFPSVTQLDQFALLENAMNTTAGGSCFDPSSSSSLYYSQAALSGLGGSHGSLQDPVHMRSNMLYSNCSGGLPNIILTGESGFRFFMVSWIDFDWPQGGGMFLPVFLPEGAELVSISRCCLV